MSDDIKKHYQHLFSDYRDSYQSNQYSSKESQEARFTVLSQIGNLQYCKILDWGCGTSHFATWLENKKIVCDYTGIDIVPDFIELGQKKHPNKRFGALEAFENETFDWCFISGVFNNRIADNKTFFINQIHRLWKLCRKGLTFNLISSYVDYEEDHLWYVPPEYIFSEMKKLTPYIVLRNDYVVKNIYIPFDFTVYLYRHPIRPTL